MQSALVRSGSSRNGRRSSQLAPQPDPGRSDCAPGFRFSV